MPFGRAGRVEEVTALTAFLASDLSGYTIVTVDGGMAQSGAGLLLASRASG